MLGQLFEKVKQLFSGSEAPKASASKDRDKAEGVIVYFNHRRGFGFVKSPDVEDRIFLHVSELEGKASKGKRVTFGTVRSEEGIRAVEAKILP